MTRRRFLSCIAGGACAAGAAYIAPWRKLFSPPLDPLLVNDMHAQLNETRVSQVLRPESLEDLIGEIKALARSGRPLAISGSRHAMGGQQFLSGEALLDCRGMNGIIDFDKEQGVVDVEAGIEWPDLVEQLHAMQPASDQPWTIPTKQTGADKLTLGGALSANAHGRSLNKPPMISDVQSFRLVNAKGEVVQCSRSQNHELFSLAIGGYGLFGVIHSASLKLARRQKIRRVVKVISAEELPAAFQDRIENGFILGDFQFNTNEADDDFLQAGVFSCYEPVPIGTQADAGQDKISQRQWDELVYLAHTDKARAFKLYSDFYMKSSGQIYWSDTSQLGKYPQDYHQVLDERMHATHPASEMIAELYVPRDQLPGFLSDAARELRRLRASVIYGTIRLIEKDTESFLPWAKLSYACVIFNLHVEHSDAGLKLAEAAFRTLNELALERDGSYYLTYHRWAPKDQVLQAYPGFSKFLEKKLEYDPQERFQSEWYRHHRQMFA